MSRIFLCLLFISLFVCDMEAQIRRRQTRTVELGVMGGLSIYSGDLSPKELGLYFEQLKIAGGIFGRINYSQYLSMRLGLSFAQLGGDDSNTGYTDRGLNFRTNITELALTGEFNIFRLGNPKAFHVAPYIFGGVALYHFNPQGELDGDWIDLQPLGTEGQGLPGYEKPYNLTQFAVPAGVGLKVHMNPKLTLGFEFGARKLFTDHLDDISDVQVNYYDVLEGNGTLAARMSNPTIGEPTPENVNYVRGGQYEDWYYIGGVTLSFKLGEKGGPSGRGIGCPTF